MSFLVPFDVKLNLDPELDLDLELEVNVHLNLELGLEVDIDIDVELDLDLKLDVELDIELNFDLDNFFGISKMEAESPSRCGEGRVLLVAQLLRPGAQRAVKFWAQKPGKSPNSVI